MSRGSPDFGAYASKEVTATLADMGELAARLGSIVIYDKRGDVVDFDNFEEPVLRWKADDPNAATYVRLDSYSVKSGSQAAKLHTDDVAEEVASMFRQFSVLASKQLAHEISFSKLSISLDFYMYIVYYTGTEWREAEVKVDPIARTLSIRLSATEFAEIADIGTLLVTPHCYQTVKLVADFNTSKYVRLLFGPNQYDIAAYDLYVFGSDITPRVSMGAWIENKNATGGDVWVDDSIFTQAEP